MVYINRDGRVQDRRPWSIGRACEIFIGFFMVIVMFIRTLIDPLTNAANGGNSGGSRYYGGGGGGGGGGGRPGGGRDGRGPPPNRRIGRITTLSDCTIPGGG